MSQIVFIDAAVHDVADLLQGVDPQAQVVFLQAGQSGIQQITDTLAQHSNLESIHIVSHGGPGSLLLGTDTLDAAALAAQQAAIAQWGHALNANGDILLYGCAVGATAAGQDFVQSLADITQADVSASTDLTGNTTQGGDWDLEITTGAIEAGLAFDASALDNFDLVLATFNVTQTPDDGSGNTMGSLSWAIKSANETAGADTITLSSNVTLNGSMDHLITSNITVVGNGRTINGNNAFRPFFVQSGTVSFSNLTIANGVAAGADANRGGGGAGMGGGLFIYGGYVSISNVVFSGNRAIGGDAGVGTYGSGGGLGLPPGGYAANGNDVSLTGGANATGGAGVNGIFGQYGGLGGNGRGGDGLTGSGGGGSGTGGRGGFGGFGAGGGIGGRGVGGNGGGPNGAGGNGIGGQGGAGSFGGGGGRGGYGFGGVAAGTGAAGLGTGGRGGNGGYGAGGGGGGGGTNGNLAVGAGGAGGLGGFGGGHGANGGIGGGGAGMGGAIFIRSGSLVLQQVTFTNNQATGGTGANPGQGLGGALFAMQSTTNSNSNTLGMPTQLPFVNAFNLNFTGNTASNAPNNTVPAGGIGSGQNNGTFYGTIVSNPGALVDNDGDGFTIGQGDFNDSDATIYPGAPELIDGKDNDGDGLIDEGPNTTPSNLVLTGTSSLNEGGTFTLNGTFVDPDANDLHTVIIDWGDGSSNTFTPAAGVRSIDNFDHVYRDGTAVYTIAVTVRDAQGATASTTRSVTVNNVNPLANILAGATSTVGVQYFLELGTVTDPGTDTVTEYIVNWGDGNTSTFAVAGGKFHTYQAGGTFNVSVQVKDEDGTFTVGTQSVTVAAQVPDFNDDQEADILWRNQRTGQNVIWYMDGSPTAVSRIDGVFIDSITDLNWQSVGFMDGDGDGTDDIVWQNKVTGQIALWYMDGADRKGGDFITNGSNLGSTWQARGIGDFNTDGQSDLIFHNQTTGQVVIWFLEGTDFKGGVFVGPNVTDQNWKLEGVGDFDGDGKRDDLVWRNYQTGVNGVWYTEQGVYQSNGFFQTLETTWRLEGVTDFDRDGKIDDLLWRQQTSSGANAVWFMENTTRLNGVFMTPGLADLNWTVVV